MKIIVLFLFLLSSNIFAYCISNKTPQKLYFMVEFYTSNSSSTLTFKQYINAHETKCCEAKDNSCNPTSDKDKKLSFYAFINENSLEGCDTFGTQESNIILTSYEVFDNCIWK